MKHLATLLFTLVALFSASTVSAGELVDEPANFDYLAADGIYLVTEDEAILYAKFPRFWDLKGILLNALDRELPDSEMNTGRSFTMYVLSGDEYSRLEVNGPSLTDGTNVGYMDADAYARFIDIVEERRGTGSDPALLERHLRAE